MMWFLAAFCAIVAAFILYSSIEDDIPEHLGLPKTGKNSGALVANAPEAGGVVAALGPASSSAWQVRGDGRNVELVREFQGRIEANGQRFDAPVFAVTCYEGEVFARVDLRMAVAGGGDTARVVVNGVTQTWRRGVRHELFSPAPKALLSAMRSEQPVELVLPYAELGAQSATFSPKGLSQAMAQLPPACRPG
jgi:hypothetical protein